MTPEEYFGKDCADSIRQLLTTAYQYDQASRADTANRIRADAVKEHTGVVRDVLLRIAEAIENMEDKIND